MANDVLASLLHAFGSGAKAYGQSKMRSIEDESAARKKQAAEDDKRKRELDDQVATFKELGDPNYDFLAEKALKLKRPLSSTDMKLFLDAKAKEGDVFKMFGDELEKMMGQGGVDWRTAAQAEGVVPAMIETPSGRASAAERLVDYGKFNPNADAMKIPPIPGFNQGPMSPNPEWVRRVEEERKNRAILKAKNEKEINDIKNPPKSDWEEGVSQGIKQKGKESVTGTDEDKTKSPLNPNQYSGYIDGFVKEKQTQFLSDLASELGVDDGKKMTRDLLVQKAKEGLSKTSSTLFAWPKGDLLPGETKPAPDTYWSDKLKEFDAIDTEYRKQITDNPSALYQLNPAINWDAVVEAKNSGKAKRTPNGVRPVEQLPKDEKSWSAQERTHYKPPQGWKGSAWDYANYLDMKAKAK